LKNRKLKKPLLIFSIINIIFTISLIIFITKLNILPIRYIILLVVGLLIVDIICFFFIKSKKKPLRIIGYIISILFMIICLIGSYYLHRTNKFLDEAFNNSTNTYTNTYYVIVPSDSSITELTDLKDSIIAYYNVMPNIESALDKLEETISFEKKSYEDMTELLKDLDKENVDATIIEESIYEALTDEEVKVIKEEDYKIIYTFDLETEEEVEEITDDGNNFSVYIAGVDFTEKNTDLNMVVTVNKKTHKILLTSIPRDYYVTASGTGMKELLGYVGYYGINTSRKTMEELFDLNIDYYVKINTESIVGLVDTLGGIQFCSDISFTTTHAMILGNYDDSTGQKLYVEKGCKTYNGIQILTILRERKAYTDGDRQRQKNCQDVLITIIKTMLKTENLTNYSNILNSVSNLYTTNLSRDVITELARDTIDNGVTWTFEQQSVTGRDSSGYVHMGTVKDYVMVPNEDSLASAISKIKTITSGK
jgi:LCP family protein required for cell wall assembly